MANTGNLNNTVRLCNFHKNRRNHRIHRVYWYSLVCKRLNPHTFHCDISAYWDYRPDYKRPNRYTCHSDTSAYRLHKAEYTSHHNWAHRSWANIFRNNKSCLIHKHHNCRHNHLIRIPCHHRLVCTPVPVPQVPHIPSSTAIRLSCPIF